MGKNSEIAWTHHTFNPWWGCTKVSAGCANCYADTLAHRYGFDVWGKGKPRRTFGEKHWLEPIKWNKEAERLVERRRVFCGSMCDWCDIDAPPGEIDKLWKTIEATPSLDWLLLTKRPERMSYVIPERYFLGEFPRNIWLGITTENQDEFDYRYPIFEGIIHSLRPKFTFLSIEPMLGNIDISSALVEIDLGDYEHTWWTSTVDWVIVGGESGSRARPIHPDWVRSIRDQCVDAGVAFFFKQWGEWLPGFSFDHSEIKYSDWGCLTRSGEWFSQTSTWNGRQGDERDDFEYTMCRVGKMAAGCKLDGRKWQEYPS